MRLAIDRLSSPIGTLLLVSDEDDRVRALDFDDYEARMLRLLKIHYGDPTIAPGPAPAAVRCALDAYFAGDLGAIDDIPVATGGTPFQRTVWAALRRIPAGITTSYGALAAGIGRPSAMRAVGLAVGSNPVAVIVPCHRVIGANHSLAGYAGGLSRKRWLLEHEGLELSGGRVRQSQVRGSASADAEDRVLSASGVNNVRPLPRAG
jgi:O-6-methylguanine DNA methyltransferase